MNVIMSIICIIAVAGIATSIYLYFKYAIPICNGVRRQTEFEEQTKLIADIREAVTSHILTENVSVFNAIAKQKIILNTNKRNAIAIFLSDTQFRDILNELLGTTDHTDALVETLITLNVPVAFIGDLPVYVSALLTEAPVFVAGGIKWEFDD